MSTPSALLVSNDPTLIDSVQGVVDPIANLHLHVMTSADAACAQLRQLGAALVLFHQVKGSDGAEIEQLLRTLVANRSPVATLVLSDEYLAGQALTLLRLGAADYLGRPLDLARLAYLIDVLTVRVRYLARRTTAAATAPGKPWYDDVCVQSLGEQNPFFFVPTVEMGRMMDQVRRVAPQDTTILLAGETGTGKTRLAYLIHDLSPRREQALLAVNCGALSATLIESEIFGHVKGAFTGADRDRAGKFADAGCGTLLLDEIDALPLLLQAKLLRAVEERVFEPVGSNQTMPVRARLIAASNRSLEREVAAGRFRADLYYRLNVVGFHLPALREQRALIVPLVHKFIAEFAARNRRPVHGISPEAMQALQEYNWPGNIREVRNFIERAVALCAGPEIQPDDLYHVVRPALVATDPAADYPPLPALHAPFSSGSENYERRGELGERRIENDSGGYSSLPFSSSALSTLAQTKEEAEAARIAVALKKHRNNRLRAAAELGISRMTLYKKLHKYGLFGAT